MRFVFDMFNILEKKVSSENQIDMFHYWNSINEFIIPPTPK